VCHRLLTDLNDDLGVYAERHEVGRQGADQHVGLPFDLADLCLPDPEVGSQLGLCQTGFMAYGGKVDHGPSYYLDGILLESNTRAGDGLCHLPEERSPAINDPVRSGMRHGAAHPTLFRGTR